MKAIYKILNNENGKFYIGSAVDLERRWREHRSRLRGGIHPNPHLQRSWNKHGEDSFSFLVVETIEQDEDLIPAEQRWLDQERPYNEEVGYNFLPTAGSWLGYKHTEAAKAKMRKPKKKGHKQTAEHINKRIKETTEGLRKRSKLNKEIVKEIRRLREEEGVKMLALAAEFGLREEHIWKIVHKKIWKDI